jgi:transcriptional regulator GlxA family with amidase domain
VCSGAFLLAAAGLLDGRRAATHWAECNLLASGYPAVEVDRDSIYVRDGNTWTSAGVTAGIDLALALVAEDYGRKAAAAVARQLVVYLRRSGGQAQFSALLAAQDADTEPVQDLSERHFSGVCKAEVGVSPADHIDAVRLEAACRLLESTPRRHRAGGQDLRVRHGRDHEPVVPSPARHHARPAPPALRPNRDRCRGDPGTG